MTESAATTRTTAARWLTAALAVCLTCGCQTIRSPLDTISARSNGGDSKTDEAGGSFGRLFSRRKAGDTTSLSPAAGRDEYEKAAKLFAKKRYADAEKAAKAIAKKYKNSPVREDALFLIAEAQYEQKRYPSAQDGYELLVKEFPSTRYLETRNKRLFNIARTWLDDPSYATSDNVQLADFKPDGTRIQATAKTKRKKKRGFDISRTIPVFPNFWDRSRPVFDTEGRALEALKSIWLHDPTGTLADDALMLTAGYYLREGNYGEADHLYTLLRDEYPKSRHSENAHVLGGFVKQASYQGPQYDGAVLTEARDLKQRALRLYPNTAEKDRLKRDLRNIELASAASDWELVRFYQRKNRPASVKVCCRVIISDHPNSPYAEKARDVLEALGEATDRPRRRRESSPPSRQEPRRFQEPKVAPRLPPPRLGAGTTERRKPVLRDSRNDTPARVRL